MNMEIKNIFVLLKKELEKTDPKFLRRVGFMTLEEMEKWMIDNSDIVLRLANDNDIIIPVCEE